MVQKGSVNKVYPQGRKVLIDNVMYYLAPKLIVRDKNGEILPEYRISYLSWTAQIEFVSIDYMITEIKILKIAS